MNTKNFFKLATVGIVMSIFAIGCNSQPEKKTADDVTVTAEPVEVKTDMARIKAEIQSKESAWAAADNAREENGVLAFYSDDAVSFSNNAPMSKGKAAIQKELGFDKRTKGETVSYDTQEVFGDENTVTEIGTTTSKDASGKVIRTGKYMAIWEKRDGDYICIRDIYNDNAVVK